jgi:hypothetical protein
MMQRKLHGFEDYYLRNLFLIFGEGIGLNNRRKMFREHMNAKCLAERRWAVELEGLLAVGAELFPVSFDQVGRKL